MPEETARRFGLSVLADPSPARLRWALGVAGLLGVFLPLLVVTTAVAGFGRVREATAENNVAAQAQRFQQDADQAHDAIEADVLVAVHLVERAGVASSGQADVRRELSRHTAALSQDLSRLQRLNLPTGVARQTATEGRALRRYATQARTLVDRIP